MPAFLLSVDLNKLINNDYYFEIILIYSDYVEDVGVGDHFFVIINQCICV